MITFGLISDPFWTRVVQSLEKLHKRFSAGGLVVVAIALDQDLAAVRKFAEQNRFTFPVAVDNQKMDGATKYKLSATPMTIFVDRPHKIVYKQLGFAPALETVFAQQADKIVTGPPAAGR
ncbi:MAG: TlpA family protein disulfide reductase [Armatimonadota bacterium]